MQTGTRGATSAEYFLRAGYAVIFMHRQHSLQPYSRHYSHSTNPFLDFLELEDTPKKQSSQPPAITVRSSDPDHLRSVLSAYKEVHRLGTLHTMTFVTVNEYLWLLRAVSKELNVLGRDVLYYLAAAVSDFFLPREKMASPLYSLGISGFADLYIQSEHKIQSGKGSLILEMDQVPKILKPMVDEWTPEGFIVSFKVGNLNPRVRLVLLTSLSLKQIQLCLYQRHAPRLSVTGTKSSSATNCTDGSTKSSSSRAHRQLPVLREPRVGAPLTLERHGFA